MSAVPVQETLAVSYVTETFNAPAGPIATMTATLTGSAVGNTTPTTLVIPLDATSVSALLVSDTYSYTIVNADVNGNDYGGPFTGSFTVTAPATVTLSLASGLTVS